MKTIQIIDRLIGVLESKRVPDHGSYVKLVNMLSEYRQDDIIQSQKLSLSTTDYHLVSRATGTYSDVFGRIVS